MKKLLGIVVLGLLLSGNAYSHKAKIHKPIVCIPESERTEENKLYGCTSQAWVLIDKQEDRTFYFRTDSDAMIVKGLLTLLVKIFNGQTASEIRSVDGSVILNSIGLLGAVSNQRTNGFSSAVEKIQQLAS